MRTDHFRRKPARHSCCIRRRRCPLRLCHGLSQLPIGSVIIFLRSHCSLSPCNLRIQTLHISYISSLSATISLTYSLLSLRYWISSGSRMELTNSDQLMASIPSSDKEIAASQMWLTICNVAINVLYLNVPRNRRNSIMW